MKCISLWQPWASLLAHGIKRVETRSWSTAYRGRVAIHSAKAVNKGISTMCAVPPLSDAIACLPEPRDLPLGYLLGTANLVEIFPTRAIQVGAVCEPEVRDGNLFIGPQEFLLGHYADTRYGWLFDKFEPIDKIVPMLGRQGLFEMKAADFPTTRY